MTTGLILGIITIVEIIILVNVGRAYWAYAQLKKHGLKAKGEITDYKIRTRSKGRKTYFPVVRFRTLIGEEIHQKSPYGLSTRQYIEKNTQVDIIYSGDNPARFMIESYNPTLSFVLVSVTLLIGYALAASILVNGANSWLQTLPDSLK